MPIKIRSNSEITNFWEIGHNFSFRFFRPNFIAKRHNMRMLNNNVPKCFPYYIIVDTPMLYLQILVILYCCPAKNFGQARSEKFQTKGKYDI